MLRIITVLYFLDLFQYELCRGNSIDTEDWRIQGLYRPRRNYPSQSFAQRFKWKLRKPFGIGAAGAMRVPEPEDDDDDDFVPDFINSTQTNVAPVMAMKVPEPEEDDNDEIIPAFRTITQKPNVAPAIAMKVPEPEDDDSDEIISDSISTTNRTTTTTTTTIPTTIPSTTTTTTTTPSTTTSASTTLPTTTTRRQFTWTFHGGHAAKAMKVPEPELDDDDDIVPDFITSTQTNVAPAMAMKVPEPEEDDNDEIIPDFRTITQKPNVAPAIAMKVPEPEDDDGDEIIRDSISTTKITTTTTNTTIPTTIPSTTTTTTTTLPTTTTRRQFTWTFHGGHAAKAMKVPEPEDDDDDDIVPDFITSTQTNVTPAMAMKVPEPEEDDNDEIIPDFRTITQKPNVAPAIAMKVPEPEDDDGDEIIRDSISTTKRTTTTTTTTIPTTIPSTTTTTTTTPSTTNSASTTLPTTTSSATTPETTTSTTTTTTTPSTTTSTSITPPTITSTTTTPSTTTATSTTTTTTPSTTIALSTSTSITTVTTPDHNRNVEETTTPSTTTVSTTEKPTTTRKPFRDIDISTTREKLTTTTEKLTTTTTEIPTTTTEKLTTTTEKRTTIKPYMGPLYLPPEEECVPKTRRRRATNEITLRLGDVKGTPRPVWYTGIYRKTTDPYFPICGGSIVREDIVISAAHCFWDDVVGKQPTELFAVAASKIYKPWKDPMDKKAQKSDVLDIKIPPRFLGAKTSFQEDIAILKLTTPFRYTKSVKPICVDFDDEFDRRQMKAGHQGTVAGWGLTDSQGTPTQRLLWLELPYIEIEKCIRDSEDAFLKYITSDKVCAGENDTGKALCRGDSGGGLAFWSGPADHATPYLRGIASTAPSPQNAECNVYAYGSFTHIRAHRTFLRDHVPDIEMCRFWG